MNLAFFIGKQWIAWDGQGLFTPALKPNRITLVDNRIMPCVRTEVAKLTKTRPVFTISPTTADEDDAHAAELGEQLMRYLWKHLSLRDITTKALWWSRICGNGFLKCFWDPSAGYGTDCVVGPDGNVLTDGSGKPIKAAPGIADQMSAALSQATGQQTNVTVQKVNQGDICVEARSPFQMCTDPLADSFSEVEWLVEESVKSVESCQKRYNQTLVADTVSNPGLIEARMGAAFLPGTSSYKGVKIREYWCKPNSENPQGKRVVWSKDKILLEDNNPFDALPYVMFTAIPVPGRLQGTCITEQLRPQQMELNKLLSQIAENCNRVGNPTILASKQAVQDPDKFTQSTTMPGGIYFFDDVGSPNAVPTYLQAPPLPNYVVERYQQIEDSIQTISGQHETTTANVPAGVTAASAINLLMEADDTQLGPGVTDYEENLGILGQKILKLAAHYYTDTRTIRIGGDNGVWQIKDFRGSMLRNNTHVEVQTGSAFPQSKAAKQAAMQDLLTFFVQSGNPPHGKQLAQFLEDSEFGGAERLVEDFTRDEMQVNRENVQMQQEIPLEINDYDDDQIHVDEHQDQQKDQSYQQWPPQAQQIMEAHVAAHKQRLAQQQAAQQQLEMQQQNPQMAQQQAQGAQDAAGAAQQQAQQAQGAQQQQDIQGAQAQQQIAATGAQQGQQMAMSSEQHAQSARHAEEQHQQKLRHAEEQHQSRLRQAQAPKGNQR